MPARTAVSKLPARHNNPTWICCRCSRPLLALNRRPSHGKARQVLGEDRSRQLMIGAAVHDPKQTFMALRPLNRKPRTIPGLSISCVAS
jgi:hypothetical protein